MQCTVPQSCRIIFGSLHSNFFQNLLEKFDSNFEPNSHKIQNLCHLMSAFADKKKKKKGKKGKKGKGGKAGKGGPILLNAPDNQIQRIGALNSEFFVASNPPIFVDYEETDSDLTSSDDSSDSDSSDSSDLTESEDEDLTFPKFQNIRAKEYTITSTTNSERIRGQFNSRYSGMHIYNNDSSWYTSKTSSNAEMWKQLTTIIKNSDVQAMENAVFHADDSKRIPIDVTDRYFKTPLMLAAGGINLEFVNYLLKNGADPNKTDQFKWSALHHACTASQSKPKKPNNSRVRPQRKTAQEHSGMDAVKMANEVIAKSTDPEDTAPAKKINELPSVKIVRALLAHGADVEAQTNTGATPLIKAIQANSLPVVHALIQNGANIMVTTEIKKPAKKKKGKKGKKGDKGKDKKKSGDAAGGKEKNVLEYATEWGDIDLYNYVRLVYEKEIMKSGGKDGKGKKGAKKGGTGKKEGEKGKKLDSQSPTAQRANSTAASSRKRTVITPAQRERNANLETMTKLNRAASDKPNGNTLKNVLDEIGDEGITPSDTPAKLLASRDRIGSKTLSRSVLQLDGNGHTLITKKKYLTERAELRQNFTNEVDFGGYRLDNKPLALNLQRKIRQKE